jgi:hypothetical protein
LGYCGHGVVNGFYFGSQLAKLITGQPCQCPFLGLAFPGFVLYQRRPWFLPIVGAYYKLGDRLAAWCGRT